MKKILTVLVAATLSGVAVLGTSSSADARWGWGYGGWRGGWGAGATEAALDAAEAGAIVA
jgi:hypothetical protein